MSDELEKVGPWAKDKHRYLRRYVDICSAVRRKFLDGPGGATYIDLFCGSGRARIRGTDEIIDGSAIVAWKQSQRRKTPFSTIYIADANEHKRRICAQRLRTLDAPVVELKGDAITAAETLVTKLNPIGLHLAFIDPYSLGALDFRIIRALARLQRMDMLIHISTMDMQRNVLHNITGEMATFDTFAPGWRKHVDIRAKQQEIRSQLIKYWISKIERLGCWPPDKMKLISGEKNQRLYWLLVAAKHDLARKFWKIAADDDPQRSFDF